uniref:Uncharacterized protein n=1 Tax=Panagrolaimus superbus TaxID=310955 RepID=A0A914YLP7_9BILA
MESFSSSSSTTTSLEQQFAAIMNTPVVVVGSHENSPPFSYTAEDPSPLLQMFQNLITMNEKYVQLSLDAYNLHNPRVELPSDPLKDISTIAGKDLSNAEIVEFLKNPGPWRPSSTYDFPFDESRKRARHAWFVQNISILYI